MDTKKMVFVFGSNTAGIMGAGAAKEAYKNRGARWGLSYGHFGDSFAIPTKGHGYNVMANEMKPFIGSTLNLFHINQFVQGFLAYAVTHPELDFQVTCLGCGLAGLKHEDIAPMFGNAPENCYFDTAWQPILDVMSHGEPVNYWGTF
jgi:hypothetical protein